MYLCDVYHNTGTYLKMKYKVGFDFVMVLFHLFRMSNLSNVHVIRIQPFDWWYCWWIYGLISKMSHQYRLYTQWNNQLDFSMEIYTRQENYPGFFSVRIGNSTQPNRYAMWEQTTHTIFFNESWTLENNILRVLPRQNVCVYS